MRFGAIKPLILIVGFGNPLRADDGVGWYVINLLQHVSFEHSVKLLACHQLMPELVEEVVERPEESVRRMKLIGAEEEEERLERSQGERRVRSLSRRSRE